MYLNKLQKMPIFVKIHKFNSYINSTYFYLLLIKIYTDLTKCNKNILYYI